MMRLFEWLIKRPWRYTTAVVVVVLMGLLLLGWATNLGMTLIFATPFAVLFGNALLLLCSELHAEWIAYGSYTASDVEYVKRVTQNTSQF